MFPMDECSKSFETILYHSGKFGSYQRRLYVIMSAMHVVCSSILSYTNLFPHLEHKHHCREIITSVDFNNTFLFLRANETVTYPVTCHSYYDNDKGLELDWVFPLVSNCAKVCFTERICCWYSFVCLCGQMCILLQ